MVPIGLASTYRLILFGSPCRDSTAPAATPLRVTETSVLAPLQWMDSVLDLRPAAHQAGAYTTGPLAMIYLYVVLVFDTTWVTAQ